MPRPSGRAASRPSSRPAGVSRSKLIAASLATFVAGGLLGYLLRSNPPVPDPQTLQQTLPVVTVTVEAEAAP